MTEPLPTLEVGVSIRFTRAQVRHFKAVARKQGKHFNVWVRETLGRFWAVQQACWTMATAVVWLAMFPVLFVTYLAFLVPTIGVSGDAAHPWMGPVVRWLIALLVILTGMAINLRGAREVGGSAKINAGIVLGAFALLLMV